MRIYINTKPILSFLIVLLLVLTFNVTTSDAQDSPQLIHTLIGHDWAVLSVAFSPDSTTLASGSADWTAILWDTRTGDLRHSLPHTFYRNARDAVKDVAFSPDGSILASIIEGSRVHLWNVETGTLRNRFYTDTGGSVSIAFSPDGATVATGDGHADNRVRLWNVATGEARHILRGHTDAVYDLAFSPDGRILASGAWDGTIRLWNAETGAPLNTLQHNPGSRIHSVDFSPDGTILAGAQDAYVHFWDVETGTRRNTIDANGVIQSVAFSPDGATLAGGGNGPRVRLWDVATGTLKHTLTDAQGTITSVDISPDGTMLAAGTWADQAVYVWQLAPTSAPIIFNPESVPDQTFTVGTPVNLTLPSATGGTSPYTYTLDPIPAGLQFDTTTQLLSGTPTTPTPATSVTYTATDAAEQTVSLTFSVTVVSNGGGTDAYIYWADADEGKIRRANIDGTNVQDFIAMNGSTPWDLAIDIPAGKIYWTDRGRNKIYQANLDGTDIQGLLNITRPGDITLDVASGKMYWIASGTKIQRANLDGSNVEDLVTGLNSADPIAVNVSGGKIYWAEWSTRNIRRSDLNGTNIEDIITSGVGGIACIELDVANDKMYLIDNAAAKIRCANLDGRNLEDLVATGLRGPSDMDLDLVNGKMYWTDHAASKVQRANLDGSNVEDLVSIGSSAIGIVLGIPQPSSGLRFSPNVIADQTFTVGTDVSLNLPVATGGTEPYTYTLTPNLPAELYFDPIADGPGYIGGTPTAVMQPTNFTYTATDTTGASASLTFSIEVVEDGAGPGDDPLDVNGDGQVTVLDLAIVALLYGTRVPVGVSLAADVNADGVVDLADLTAVAEGIDAAGGGVNQLSVKEVELALLIAAEQAAELEAAAGSPGRAVASVSVHLAAKNVSDALAAARTDLRKPQEGFAVLEKFLALLTELTMTPDTTALLANYPNPFNPETWIPYHLSKDAEVIMRIYDMRGVSIRELVLGHQSAGVYESRGRAAYWDGRNDSGEPVASGVYFYTLTAGDFTATRKMLIRK